MSANTQHLNPVCTDIRGTPRTVTGWSHPLVAALRRLRDRMILARQRRVTINELARLSDRQLDDIGIQRGLIPKAVDDMLRHGPVHQRTAGSKHS